MKTFEKCVQRLLCLQMIAQLYYHGGEKSGGDEYGGRNSGSKENKIKLFSVSERFEYHNEANKYEDNDQGVYKSDETLSKYTDGNSKIGKHMNKIDSIQMSKNYDNNISVHDTDFKESNDNDKRNVNSLYKNNISNFNMTQQQLFNIQNKHQRKYSNNTPYNNTVLQKNKKVKNKLLRLYLRKYKHSNADRQNSQKQKYKRYFRKKTISDKINKNVHRKNNFFLKDLEICHIYSHYRFDSAAFQSHLVS